MLRSRGDRREVAERLAAARESRSDEQQLARLDAQGHRAVKERARLEARIEKEGSKK